MGDSARRQGSVRVTERGIVTGMKERLHAKSKLPDGAPDVRAGSGTARPNRACDDGIKGPLTEPQTDGSRRTILGASNGLQWAAHLDLLKILLHDRLDQEGLQEGHSLGVSPVRC